MKFVLFFSFFSLSPSLILLDHEVCGKNWDKNGQKLRQLEIACGSIATIFMTYTMKYLNLKQSNGWLKFWFTKQDSWFQGWWLTWWVPARLKQVLPVVYSELFGTHPQPRTILNSSSTKKQKHLDKITAIANFSITYSFQKGKSKTYRIDTFFCKLLLLALHLHPQYILAFHVHLING